MFFFVMLLFFNKKSIFGSKILIVVANKEYPDVWHARQRIIQDKEYSFLSTFTEKDAKACTGRLG